MRTYIHLLGEIKSQASAKEQEIAAKTAEIAALRAQARAAEEKLREQQAYGAEQATEVIRLLK